MHVRLVTVTVRSSWGQGQELRRIVGAGGFVAMNRVCGSLAVTVSRHGALRLGDYDFKTRRHPTLAAAMQQVSAEPTCTGAVACVLGEGGGGVGWGGGGGVGASGCFSPCRQPL
jgi:hypothetical protein